MPKWDPDWVISPGETLRDWMEENGFTAGDRLLIRPVATACGRMRAKNLEGLFNGTRRLTHDDAYRLEAGTGIPARLWINLERQFRQGLKEGKTWVR